MLTTEGGRKRTRLARKLPLLAFAAALLCGALPFNASAAGTGDAQCTLVGPPTGFRDVANFAKYAQTFTALKSGRLLTAEMTGINRTVGGTGTIFEAKILATGSGGLPGPELAVVDIPAASIAIGAPTTLTADFPAATAAQLVSGQQYALYLSSDDNVQDSWDFGPNPCLGDAYVAGHSGAFGLDPGIDFGFKIYLGPANDDFSKPQVLAGESASTNGTTAGGTREVDEPDHYVTPPPGPSDVDSWMGEHSVWYTWTAPNSGLTTMDTCTAAIDSILAVYTGSSIGALSHLADNNNDMTVCPAGTYGSALSFVATAGTTYRIAVGDAGGLTQSTFTLEIAGALDPQTQIDSGPSGTTNIASPSLSFSSSKPGSSFECRLDSTHEADFGACASPKNLSSLADGPHSFEVRAIDTDGNTDPTPASRGFTVDATAPETTITRHARPVIKTRKRRVRVKFAFRSNDPGAAFSCKLDRRALAQCGSPKSYEVRKGRHKFTVLATDAAGNVGAAKTFRFKVKKKHRHHGG